MAKPNRRHSSFRVAHSEQVPSSRVRGQTPDLTWRALSAVSLAVLALALAGSAATAKVDRFDEQRAFALLRAQVELGPRPAGSPASRTLAERLKRLLPNGRFQPVPDGLRNVIGVVRGRNPTRTVVVGAHYDTKDIPGFVGANDGASGTATVAELARTIKPRQLRPTVVFILFDGEESPKGTPDSEFERYGLRGSKAAARTYKNAEAMILLDFVGEKDLSIPHEDNSDKKLWRKLRAAAAEVGTIKHFPRDLFPPVSDDHIPFIRLGIPSIDLIDFDFACFHKTCDDMSQIGESSLDATGETVLRLLATL
jgi:glutaminyl-peptide cyclotransferase